MKSHVSRSSVVTAERMAVLAKRSIGSVVPRWYYLAAAFLVIHALEAFDFVDQLVYGRWHGGDMITKSLNLLLIVVSLALFGRGGRGTRSVGPGANLALGLGGFLLCSALWSVDPGATLRQALIYLPVVIGSIGVASNLEADEYMDLLARICFWAAIASLALFAVSPASADDPINGFRGIFSQKNVLGEAMAIGALASLHGLRAGNGRRLRSAIYLASVVALALMSASATSCLTIFVYCVASAVIALIRRGGAVRILGVLGIMLALPIVVYVAAFPDSLFEAIGKSPTLTGRTEIWAAVDPYIWQRPALGWGFAAFWSHNNPAAIAIQVSLNWFFPQAHNGLLELLLEVGLVGTGFFLFLLLRTVWKAVKCSGTAEQELAITCLLLCIGLVLTGITEAVLVVALQASTSVFFITGFLCERAVRTARRPEAQERRRDDSGRALAASGPSTGWRSRRGEQPRRVYARRPTSPLANQPR